MERKSLINKNKDEIVKNYFNSEKLWLLYTVYMYFSLKKKKKLTESGFDSHASVIRCII